MSIRCASKAIILKKGYILLNKCINENGRIYYDLPGGGQGIYESLEQAVVREVKEETGYDVRVDKFIALAEEIYTSDELREKLPNYTHRIFHVFKAEIIGENKEDPTETDYGMEESVWMPLNNIEYIAETCSPWLSKLLISLEKCDTPLYLGTEYKN